MKQQTIACHEVGHSVVAQRLGYRVGGASIVPREGKNEGHVNMPRSPDRP